VWRVKGNSFSELELLLVLPFYGIKVTSSGEFEFPRQFLEGRTLKKTQHRLPYIISE
jgi:hypothetical protein